MGVWTLRPRTASNCSVGALQNPFVQIAVFSVVIALLATSAVVLLPAAGAIFLAWLAYKAIQSHQTAQQIKLRDAELMLALEQAPTAPDSNEFTDTLFNDWSIAYAERNPLLPHAAITYALIHATRGLYAPEGQARPVAPASADALDLARWRDDAAAYQDRANDPMVLDKIQRTIKEYLTTIAAALPQAALQTPEEYQRSADGDLSVTGVPVVELMTNPGHVIEDAMAEFYNQELKDAKLFVGLRETFDRNLHAASNMPYSEATRQSPKLVLPSVHRGTPNEIANLYLRGTPLLRVFLQQVPCTPPAATRFEHHWIVAGSGHGKTNAISTMLAGDLDAVARGECSIVLMDSQNQIVPTIANLRVFAPGQPLHGKLVVIDPSDIEYPVQLNLFAIGNSRINSYSLLDRERLLNSAIELYDFVLAALLGSEMTGRQGTLFRFATQLMMVIPDATIHTFRQLMQPGGYDKFKPYIDALEGTAKEFFATQFNSKISEQTKQQVVARLFTICENRTFERLFTHPKSKFDLFTEINSGKVILINTAKDLLKQQGTEVFGRFFLALIGQAAQERATLANKLPVFCYIDECQDYIASDSNFTVILEQARKQNIGMIVAHQYLSQLSQKTLDSLYANTSIKYAGGVSDRDAHALARNMSTEPQFIMQQPKGTFAAFIRNFTKHAIALSLPLSDLNKRARMTKAEYESVRADLRSRYAVPLKEVHSVAAVNPAPDAEQTDFSDRY